MRFVKNEWIKIWSQRNAWIMLVLLLVAVGGLLGLNKYFSDDASTKEARLEANESVKRSYEQLIEEMPDPESVAYHEEQLMIAQYRIDNDLPSPGTAHAMETFDIALTIALSIGGIFAMVIAASIVSNEFGTGTIKMLLTRPVARWKILLSKLVATLLFGLTLFTAAAVLGAAMSFLLFETSDKIELLVQNGQVVEQVVEYDIVKSVLLNMASIFMSILFAFMLSTLFGSSTLAVSLALGIMFMGTMVTAFLSKYAFTKFIWFANDLTQFANGGMPIIEGITFNFALIVNIVYAIIFLAISFIYFTRRDVTA